MTEHGERRRPARTQSLVKLRAMGIPINGIIDVGMLTGTYDLMKTFADVPQLLIEPIVEWNDTLRSKYTAAGVRFELINVAASDMDGEMNMRTSSVREGKPITHANLTGATTGDNLRKVPVRRLDTLLAERPGFAKPWLLKIDVDGVELQILAGAAETLRDCSVVVVEAGIRTFMERAAALQAHGFELFDIVELCYYDDRLRQFDLVFVKTQILNRLGLDMYKQPFDITKWFPFR